MQNSKNLWVVSHISPAYSWPSQFGWVLDYHQTLVQHHFWKAVCLLGFQKTTLHWTLKTHYKFLCPYFVISHRASAIFSVVSETVPGSKQWATKQNKRKIPTQAANKTSAHYAEIALACRSLVISFVSNVLIVTDYMLLSSPWHLLYSGIDFCAPVWKGHFDQCSVIGTKLGSYQVILLFNDEILKNSMGRLQALKCTLNLL